MQLRSALLLTLLWLLAAAAQAHAQTPTQPPGSAPGSAAPRLADADCAEWMIPEEYDAKCGYVTVPERRDGASQQMIQIAYLWLHSTAAEPDAPVVVLSGGRATQASTHWAAA